jgi:phosphatidate cytidylyltransferase
LKSDDPTSSDLPTGEMPAIRPVDSRVTITGAEVAAEAAGLAVPTPTVDPETLLPHWTEEPTGQIPAVLQREEVVTSDPLDQIPAPVWREDETDYTVHDEQIGQIIGNVESSDPLEVELDEVAVVEVPVAEAPRPTQSRAERLRQSDQKLLKNRSTRTAPPKDIRKATITGLLAAIVVAGIFVAGPIPVVILVSGVLAAAIAEIFAAFRAAGARPATLLGVLATVALALGTYNRGEAALSLVSFLFIFAVFAWYLATPTKFDMLDGLGVTVVGYIWIAVMGSFAMLLISPINYKNRHGLAFLVGAIIVTVANDTGALFIGRIFGKRKLAPTISAGKTVEGAIGGLLSGLLFAVVVLPQIHPWNVGAAALLGLVAGVVAPLGDLFESLVKRTLGLKDMGEVLPGHGGVVDRIDGLLFVLPVTYYLVHILNIG